MRLSFQSPVPVNAGCRLTVVLPEEFSVSTINQVSISGLFGSLTTIDISTSTDDNSFSFEQCNSYRDSGITGNIVMDSLTIPEYAKATQSL